MTKESYNFGVDTKAKQLYTETSGMTRKRFAIEIDDENIAHILDNGANIRQYNLCKLLNELVEENEHLRHQLITLDGLYVSDKEDMSDCWRLDLFSDEAE